MIEAFDQLHARYEDAVERLVDLRGHWSLFDPDRTILQNNLYGLDLNPEAIEIARLSIWIKTARRGKILTDLDHNIRVGNSVVADSSVASEAFDWETAFPEVFEQGGFDAVIGNPPYVRSDFLAPISAHLQAHYRSFHGGADLYVYFFELGLRLLRPGGYLSYIVTNKWLKAGYAEPLRRHFAENAWADSIIDLGHAKEVFPDADVFPSIIILRRPNGTEPPEHVRVTVIPREKVRLDDLAGQVRDLARDIPRTALRAAPWTLEPPALEALFEKMRRVGVPLREYGGTAPKYGIKTAFNDAYIIDNAAERDALIAGDPKCAELIFPCLKGKDLKRWSPAQQDQWMIVMKSSGDHAWPWSGKPEAEAEQVFAATYPTLYARFKALEDGLRARKDQGHYWWELRSCDYYEQFHQPKILYTDITWRPEFSYAPAPVFFVNTVYMWPVDDLYLLGVMNSPLMWAYLWHNAQHGKDEALRLFTAFIETVPVPRPDEGLRAEVAGLVERLVALGTRRFAAVRDLLEWLRIEFGVEKPGQKLAEPWTLTRDAWIEEVRRRSPARAGLSSTQVARLRGEYDEVVLPVRSDLSAGHTLERDLHACVTRAYQLTGAEERVLWENAPPRTPLTPLYD